MNINSSMIEKVFNTLREMNPHVPDSEINKIFSQVKTNMENEKPPSIAFIGEAGVGKSTTLNALFNAGQGVSHTKACTQKESKIIVNTDKGELFVYDMPGLNESLLSQEKHLTTYAKILSEVDVAVWILDGQNRAVAAIQKLLANEITKINPEIVNKMVFAVNKIDLIHPGGDAWIKIANLPSEEQERNMKARLFDIQEKMKEAVPDWEGHIVGFSAEKRYNLPKLFSCLLDAVSKKRQWIFASRKSLADYFEFVDPQLLALVDSSLLPESTKINKDFEHKENQLNLEDTDNNIANKKSLLIENIRRMNDDDFEKMTADDDFAALLKNFSSEK